MLVDQLTMDEAQQTVLPRVNRKRRLRGESAVILQYMATVCQSRMFWGILVNILNVMTSLMQCFFCS